MADQRDDQSATAIDADALHTEMARLADVGRQMADIHGVERAYGRAWYRFWRWCDDRGTAGEALPVALPVLAEWCAWAMDELSPHDIGDTLTAIRQRHIDAGHGHHIAELGG